jgi:hypothetical protein
MENKSKMTTGELLARQLKGDNTITDEDIKKSTEDFFSSHGVKANIKIETKEKNKKDEII